MTELRRLELDTDWGRLKIVGGSRAGEGSLVLLPQLKLALDAGRAHRALPPMSRVAVSHGHVDHLGGIAHWASQRFLSSLGEGQVLAPAAIAPQVERLLHLHAELEGGRPYPVEVVPVSDETELPLRPDLVLWFFATDHWVPTLGSALRWSKRRLRRELSGLPETEIARRSHQGEEVTERVEVPLLAYAADTGPGLFATRPEVLAHQVLLLETSFFRPADRDRARQYGHLHVEDLRAVIPRLTCRHLVLLHASRRHRLREVEEYLRLLAPELPCALHHLVVDWE